jgi:hypothetical protein
MKTISHGTTTVTKRLECSSSRRDRCFHFVSLESIEKKIEIIIHGIYEIENTKVLNVRSIFFRLYHQQKRRKGKKK